MKLLIATGIYPPTVGGPATYAKLIFEELPKRGIDVSVISYDSVRRYPKIISHFLFFLKLVKASKGVDKILVQDTVSVGLPVYIQKKILNRPYIIRVPGDYAWEQAMGRFKYKDSIEEFQNKKYSLFIELLRKIQSIVVSGADTVIVPSYYFKDIVDSWISHDKKTIVIYNGVDTNRISSLHFEDKKDRHFVSAGRFVPWKEFKKLIDVFLRDSMSEYKLTIFGDGPELENIKDYVRDKKADNRIFLPGKLPRSELLKEIFASTGFILSSSFESFSFQLVEAMALGTPVIASNVCNISEIVEENKSGLLFNFFDEDELERMIKKVSEDREFSELIGNGGKKKSEEFLIHIMIEKIVSLLKYDQI